MKNNYLQYVPVKCQNLIKATEHGKVRKVKIKRDPEPASVQTIAVCMIRKYKDLIQGESPDARYVRAIAHRAEERELKLKEAEKVIRIIKELRG